MQIIECDQGSEEWLRARMGVPTASEFATVMAQPRANAGLAQSIIDAMVKNGCTAAQLAAAIKAAKQRSPSATRREYMRKLAGEILTGEPMESHSNPHMERGKEMEAEARNLYAFMNDVEPQMVGFIRSGGKGCSPDSLISNSGATEIKTKLPHLQIDCLLSNCLPPEHKAQCQGVMWVAEREWIDFVSYWPNLPLFVVREYRDEEYIKSLADAVDRFNDELAALVERIRAYGVAPVLTEQLTQSLVAA